MFNKILTILYLALGDPLVKGLTEVANKRPEDPIAFLANYLHNFANVKKSEDQKSLNDVMEHENHQQDKIKQEEQNINEKVIEKKNDAPVTRIIENHQEDNIPPSSDGPESAPNSEDRDEHGQSMLHFACARSHGRNGLIQLIEESGTSITYRDELYRTARDVALQASQPENAREIDRYVISIAARGWFAIRLEINNIIIITYLVSGDISAFEKLVIEGYDHILDVADSDDNTIIQVAETRRNDDLVELLYTIQEFEVCWFIIN